jgi:hypothetical protein
MAKQYKMTTKVEILAAAPLVNQILWSSRNSLKKRLIKHILLFGKIDSSISNIQYTLPYMTRNIKLYNN